MTITSEPIDRSNLRNDNIVVCVQEGNRFLYVFDPSNEITEHIPGKDFYGIYMYPELLVQLGLVMRDSREQWEGYGVVFTLLPEGIWMLFFQNPKIGPGNYESRKGPFLLHDFQNLYLTCMEMAFPVHKRQLTLATH